MIENSVIGLFAAPLFAALLSLLKPKFAAHFGLIAVIFTLITNLLILYDVSDNGPIRYHLGGWEAGLAIALMVDGLSALMLTMTSIVAIAISIYATSYFKAGEQKRFYWPLWMMMLCAINAILMAADLFNLYVTLELLGISAVALTALGGKKESLQAATQYLLMGLVGSLAFLAAVGLAYMAYGSLDIAVLSQKIEPNLYGGLIATLITVGLIIKTALFPMHFWLPSAHSNAPAAVSAALSALVVKAAFYLIIRLWLDLFAGFQNSGISQVFATLGALAILWGGWNALYAQRLKLLAAYSTVAQVGFLFMALAMVLSLESGELRDAIIGGMVILALSHGFAKSALFLSAGIIQQHTGHDRINELNGTAQQLPITTFTLTLAGVALIGLPPSGAFIGKWYLMSAVIHQGLWVWIVVIAIGSLLSAAYTFRLLGHAFGRIERPTPLLARGREELPALLLALLASVLLAFISAPIWPLLSTI